jgi:hypothetical protein
VSVAPVAPVKVPVEVRMRGPRVASVISLEGHSIVHDHPHALAQAEPAAPGGPRAKARASTVRDASDDALERRLDRLEQMVESLARRDTDKKNFQFEYKSDFNVNEDFFRNEEDVARFHAKVSKDAEKAAREVEKKMKEMQKRGESDGWPFDGGAKAAAESGKLQLQAHRKALEDQRRTLEKQVQSLERQIEKLEREQERIEDQQEVLKERRNEKNEKNRNKDEGNR